jgi:hypothetical protein
MKKYITGKRTFIIVLLSMITLISCDNGDDSSSIGLSDTSSQIIDNGQLAVPSLSFQETTYVDEKPFGIIFWNDQTAATHFEYQISNQDIQVINTTSLLLPYGNSLIVRAVDNNSGDTSDWSKPYVYFANSSYEENNIIVSDDNMVAVHFYDTSISPVIINRGQTVLKPNDPLKEYNTFNGWFADPHRTTRFDFSKPILQPTIIYASWIRSALIDNVSFWLKVDDKITSQVQSQPTNPGDWTFIPLRLDESVTNLHEFTATINVSGATTASPARLLAMNGFDDLPERTYWKDGNANFLITSDGTYNVQFSLQKTWLSSNSNQVHLYIAPINDDADNPVDELPVDSHQSMIEVYIDNTENIAYWDEVEGANSYQYIIDNQEIFSTEQTEITIDSLSHIIVRAQFDDGFSSWSIPVINRSVVITPITGDQLVSVYFYGLEQDSYYVIKGSVIFEPTPPEKDNYDFKGWFKEITHQTLFDFSQPINRNTVIYGKWEIESNFATVYFTNTLEWNNVYIYMWKDGSGSSYKKAWPGDLMVYLRTNSYGDDMYHYSIDLASYDYIIFTASNSGPQTVNISLSNFVNHMGYYPTTITGNKYNVETYIYNPS